MIHLTDEALGDARKAFLWYEDQRKGLGSRFSRELSSTLRRIAQSPNRR